MPPKGERVRSSGYEGAAFSDRMGRGKVCPIGQSIISAYASRRYRAVRSTIAPSQASRLAIDDGRKLTARGEDDVLHGLLSACVISDNGSNPTSQHQDRNINFSMGPALPIARTLSSSPVNVKFCSPSECNEQQFSSRSPILYKTPVPKHPMKLSRKAIDKGLDTLPMSVILGKKVSDGLTHKQRQFAREVAKGSTKADAYRAAYDVTSKHTMASKPYELMRDDRIQREIEAYELAIEAAKHRTPAALRELVIQGLVQVALNPDAKDAVKVQALKTLGNITEVAAFTERKEIRTISSSDDARARVMSELRGLLTGSATDATVIEADSLLAELAGNFTEAGAASAEEGAQDPPVPGPPDVAAGVPQP